MPEQFGALEAFLKRNRGCCAMLKLDEEGYASVQVLGGVEGNQSVLAKGHAAYIHEALLIANLDAQGERATDQAGAGPHTLTSLGQAVKAGYTVKVYSANNHRLTFKAEVYGNAPSAAPRQIVWGKTLLQALSLVAMPR